LARKHSLKAGRATLLSRRTSIREGTSEGAKKHHLEKLAKELGLSEQQKTQIKEIFKTSRSQNRQLFVDLKAEKRQLRTLIFNGGDEAAIRAESAKVAALQADLAVARGRCAQQVRALLTSDQIAKLKAHLQEGERRWDKKGSHSHDFMDESGPME